jgi:hypothetical protein
MKGTLLLSLCIGSVFAQKGTSKCNGGLGGFDRDPCDKTNNIFSDYPYDSLRCELPLSLILSLAMLISYTHYCSFTRTSFVSFSAYRISEHGYQTESSPVEIPNEDEIKIPNELPNKVSVVSSERGSNGCAVKVPFSYSE